MGAIRVAWRREMYLRMLMVWRGLKAVESWSGNLSQSATERRFAGGQWDRCAVVLHGGKGELDVAGSARPGV